MYQIGTFECPSLAELRSRAGPLMDEYKGKLTFGVVKGDVSMFHAQKKNQLALFQAASQFNCLEFVGPSVVPENGIEGYVSDRTQGPACSIACGPATAFRNYFAPVKIRYKDGTEEVQIGQTAGAQIDNLADINVAVGNVPNAVLSTPENGYTIANDQSLNQLNQVLEQIGQNEEKSADPLDGLRSLLRIGVHSDVQVTSSKWGQNTITDTDQVVTQVFGSACSVTYSRNDRALWKPFASMVLQASYEATLYAALENCARHKGEKGSKKVFLTALGGGVFGNSMGWIADAMGRAFKKFKDVDLEVYIIVYAPPVDKRILQLTQDFA
eukprot:CAMPEP_0175088470 /NCGR_PEP_ID=MMETSP0086_2-20121207/266_1 /TAXON_ID=136419 /ORGANISM="Unknown Unknown, Strain D1" /LENGTH=325 /DNA_ID=CAMNT_0016360907 /DNA_START=161 /DNA_END=1139 /DNA_ORIENTATION=+